MRTAQYFPLFKSPLDRRWEIIDKHDSFDTNGRIKQSTQFYEPDRGFASAFIARMLLFLFLSRDFRHF